ncbi:MAG: DUF4827 domain-containing protein [Muribaculaceae bacterium]|nr:DUF4827 domain-containing protein [Muribaculaceae bacterium]
MKIKKIYSVFILSICVLIFASCSKTQSYSDLLKSEQKASNWFLAQHTVCNEIPADSIFIEGSDAPYYRMDDDGYVYIQVIKANKKEDRVFPKTGDQVYFLFTRYNIDQMYRSNSIDIAPESSNQDNLMNLIGHTYFIFNNLSVNASYQYGSGIQIPVSYLGYDSEVNILLKSYYGFSSENTTCIPYLVNVRYFKPEY